MKVQRLLFIAILILLTQSACRKDNDQVPLVAVNIYINVNEPTNYNLLSIGGHETYVGGSLGILVYRNSLDEFSAFDRHSPYDVESACQVDVLEDGIIVEDPCSGSQWVITDGSVIQGPAGANLEQYDTSFNDPILHIFN